MGEEFGNNLESMSIDDGESYFNYLYLFSVLNINRSEEVWTAQSKLVLRFTHILCHTTPSAAGGGGVSPPLLSPPLSSILIPSIPFTPFLIFILLFCHS